MAAPGASRSARARPAGGVTLPPATSRPALVRPWPSPLPVASTERSPWLTTPPALPMRTVGASRLALTALVRGASSTSSPPADRVVVPPTSITPSSWASAAASRSSAALAAVVMREMRPERIEPLVLRRRRLPAALRLPRSSRASPLAAPACSCRAPVVLMAPRPMTGAVKARLRPAAAVAEMLPPSTASTVSSPLAALPSSKAGATPAWIRAPRWASVSSGARGMAAPPPLSARLPAVLSTPASTRPAPLSSSSPAPPWFTVEPARVRSTPAETS